MADEKLPSNYLLLGADMHDFVLASSLVGNHQSPHDELSGLVKPLGFLASFWCKGFRT